MSKAHSPRTKNRASPGATINVMLGGMILVALLQGSPPQFSTYTGAINSEISTARMIGDFSGNIYVYGTLAGQGQSASIVRLDSTGKITHRRNGCGPAMNADRHGNVWYLCGDTLIRNDNDGIEQERIQLPPLNASVNALTFDATGNIYLTGSTRGDFPTTSGAFQERTPFVSPLVTYAFAAKLDAGGTIVWATLLGGTSPTCGGGGSSCFLSSRGSGGASIGVDSSGNVVIAGSTSTSDFPRTEGALKGDGGFFLSKLDPSGSRLLFSFRLGHQIRFIGVPPTSTRDYINSLVVQDDGSIYLSGSTNAFDLPVTPGAYQLEYTGPQRVHVNVIPQTDAYIMKLSADGQQVLYCTYLGGAGEDVISSMSVDEDGNAWLTGTTSSPTFPDSHRAFPDGAAFLTVLNPDGTALAESLRLPAGIGGKGVVVNRDRKVALLGSTGMVNSIAFDSASPRILSIHSDASGNPRGRVAPLSVVTIDGFNIASTNPDEPLTVLFDDTPSTVLSRSANQIRVVTPEDINGKDSVTVRVFRESEIAATQVFSVVASPELYTEVLNPDGSVNSSGNPAPDGGAVRLSGTGFGLLPPEVFAVRATNSSVSTTATVFVEPLGVWQFEVEIRLHFRTEIPVFVNLEVMSTSVATPGIRVFVK